MLRSINPLIQWRVWYVDMRNSPAFVHSYSNVDGTPAMCQVHQENLVLTVRQLSQLDQTTDRVHPASRYAYLTDHEMWTGATDEDLEDWNLEGVRVGAVLRGGSLPTEIYTNALEWPDLDDDFPSMAPSGAFGIADKDRYNAALLRERPIRLGRPESQVEPR